MKLVANITTTTTAMVGFVIGCNKKVEAEKPGRSYNKMKKAKSFFLAVRCFWIFVCNFGCNRLIPCYRCFQGIWSAVGNIPATMLRMIAD